MGKLTLNSEFRSGTVEVSGLCLGGWGVWGVGGGGGGSVSEEIAKTAFCPLVQEIKCSNE